MTYQGFITQLSALGCFETVTFQQLGEGAVLKAETFHLALTSLFY